MSELDVLGNTPEPVAPAATEAPAAEVAQPEAPTPESEAQPEAKKPEASPVQKRIDQLTWKAHEAERRLNAEIQARYQAEQTAQQLWQQQQDLMRRATVPTLEQFNHDPEQYQRAVEQHNQRYLEQQQRAQHEMAQRQQQDFARARFEENLNARVAEGRQKFADYEEVVGNPALPPLQTVNPALLSAILEHERMPELTYYLGKNPGEAHRIAAMPPTRAILEVGEIAARLRGQSARQTSAAPAPPTQVGSGSGSVSKKPEDMSYDEFVTYRRKQIAARR